MRVLKFGGKSLQSTEHIDAIAKKVSEFKNEKLILIVSAMGDRTSELTKLGESLSPLNPNELSNREFDMLLASGERVSAALMAIALQKYGVKAISFTGSQAGVLTKGLHSDAQIKEIKPIRIDQALENGITPVIAGFQGVDPETKDVTTLGRGGSDLTAAAFAYHYNCKAELYKTVGCVFTCDPNLTKNAKEIECLSFNFLNLISHWGGKILHDKASQYIKAHGVNVSFYSDKTFKENTVVKSSVEKDLFCVGVLSSQKTLSLSSPYTLKKNETAVSALFNLEKDSSFTNALTDQMSSFKVISQDSNKNRITFIINSEDEVNFTSSLHSFLNEQIC